MDASSSFSKVMSVSCSLGTDDRQSVINDHFPPDPETQIPLILDLPQVIRTSKVYKKPEKISRSSRSSFLLFRFNSSIQIESEKETLESNLKSVCCVLCALACFITTNFDPQTSQVAFGLLVVYKKQNMFINY